MRYFHWQARLLGDDGNEPIQQRATTGKHDAGLYYVGREFGRCSLQCDADALDNDTDRLGDLSSVRFAVVPRLNEGQLLFIRRR